VLKFPDDCFSNLELKELYRKFKVYLQNLGDKINIQIFSKDLNSDEKKLLEDLMLYEVRGDFNSIDKTIEELEKLSPGKFELNMVGGGELFEIIKESAHNMPVSFSGWVDKPFENSGHFDLLLLTSIN